MNEFPYSKQAFKIISEAKDLAERLNKPHIGPNEIFLALANDAESFGVEGVVTFGIKISENYDELLAFVANSSTDEDEEEEYFGAVRTEMAEDKVDYAGTEHLMVAAIKHRGSFINTLLHSESIDLPEICSYILGQSHLKGGRGHSDEPQDGEISIDLANTSSFFGSQKKVSFLESGAIDLVEAYRNGKGDPIIGRDKEIELAIKILNRRSKSNPVLIGDAGVGKTAIVNGIAQKIAWEQVPDNLIGCKIYSIDMGSMMLSTMYRGQFEEKVNSIIKEVQASNGKKILFIDEIHNIVGAGKSNDDSSDLSNLLKPALSRGGFSCIGATTTQEYERYIEHDAALNRRFQPLDVKEPSEITTLKILKGIKPLFVEHHGVKISDSALQYIVKVTSKIYDKKFPDKAIDLLDDACSEAAFNSSSKLKLKRKEIKKLIELAEEKENKEERSFYEDSLFKASPYIKKSNIDKAFLFRRLKHQRKVGF